MRKLSGRRTRHPGERRRDTTGEAKGSWRKALTRLVMRKHRVRVRLAFGGVG